MCVCARARVCVCVCVTLSIQCSYRQTLLSHLQAVIETRFCPGLQEASPDSFKGKAIPLQGLDRP